jgi:integrase
MPRGRISKRSVDALKCPLGKDRDFLWDDALAGFGVGVFPTGRKVYVAQYRQNGRSRRANIGEHGRLTPDEARSLAKKLLGVVETGVDPIEARKKAHAVRTFGEVAEDFLRQHMATKRKTRTEASYRETLTKHVYPTIKSRRIVDVHRSDLARLHGTMAKTPSAANRALAVVSSVWNWAARRDEVSTAGNPCLGIERYPENARERFLTSEEFAQLGDALRLAQTTGLEWTIDESKPKANRAPKAANRLRTVDPFAIAAIRLLIFTGARLREVLHAKWEYVDFERGLMFLPDSKTGRKAIVLSAAALEVFSSLPRADLKKPWVAISKAAGLEGVRLHDLRHSFASIGAGASLGLPIIGKLLGHSQPATTARYAHLDADPMRRAANTIGATISAAMAGRRETNVVAIKKPAPG